MLGMSDKDFWRCTPRKLISLLNVHIEVHESKRTPRAFIDEIL